MVVFGAYTAYLTDTFFVEQGKAYDLEDPIIGPVVREVRKRYPDAFSDGIPAVAGPPPEQGPPVEQATAAPGEVRPTRATGSTKKRG
jgi:hypothetical protein